jgi:hypothetical protein
VTQFVEAVCYKPQGRGLDSPTRSIHYVQSIKFFQLHFGPGVDSASKKTNTRNLPDGKAQSVHKADNLTTIKLTN